MKALKKRGGAPPAPANEEELRVSFASNNVNASESYATISTSVTPFITTVRLYEETVDHVVESHPEVPAELPSVLGAVSKAVQLPSHVEKSYGSSYVYVDAETTNAGGDPLRVPVKVIEGTSAVVKTFFFATPEDDAEIVYRRTDAE